MSARPDKAVPAESQPVHAGLIRGLLQLALLIPCVVLLGWVLHAEPLKRGLPGLNAMNPLTAITVILAATASWGLKDGPARGRWRILVAVFGAAVLAIGLARLCDVFLGTQLCPDDVLFHSQLGEGQAFPSRISSNGAACFALLGAAILGLDRRGWPPPLHPQFLLLPLLLLVWTAVVGYAYTGNGFYEFRSFIPMALHTALCLLALALALILSRPREGFMRWIPRGSMGARSFRRLLPAVVVVPLVLDGLELASKASGKLDVATGTALDSVATTAVMALLAYLTALSLNRVEGERRRADRELTQRQEREQRARQWSLSVGELAELMRVGRDDLAGNAPGILGLLVHKCGALQGGLYLVDQAPGGAPCLRVLSLYAFDTPQQLERSFAFGEGLVGQCAAGRTPLRLDRVPEGYFRLRSASGGVAPRHLLLLPVLLDEEVLGVVELASLEAPGEEVEQFLTAAMRVLAFGIFRYKRLAHAAEQAAELERLRARTI